MAEIIIEEQICSISILTQPFEQQNNISLRYGDCVKCLSNDDYIAAVLGRKDNVQRKY